MKKLALLFVLILTIPSCNNTETKEENTWVEEEKPLAVQEVPSPVFTIAEANKLLELPLHCVTTEYPNKLGQVIGGDSDLKPPRELHPTFYGCFDWHSAVHGYWSMVTLLKEFPELDKAEEVRQILQQNLTKENIEKEVVYFQQKLNTSYERTYGWAWLLKLAEALHTWEDPLARELEGNLQPLTNLIAERYIEFLPKLVYPIRVGEHTNTAFGLTFAYDYAETVAHEILKSTIENRARDFYSSDTNCPLGWEPSGYDFLSPCLEEIDIMRRVLPQEEFLSWAKEFMPNLNDGNFQLEPGKVSDRTDGKLVHLDGLNFSRAWVLYGLANQYPEFNHLKNVANAHVAYSYPNLVGDSYEGGHWLGSFAIYALTQYEEK
ncbi:DUF2891 domain-containing protein [Marinirhabdus gelatinilytica]|uniref:DUF2891 domain-containing protein n=1 Tax=Marinirhabdus gelatinilytica TaxID=1703343 RepID=UPI000E0E79AB|nr:DUF2891 domain-containing protein [Marinirhabdus gelatinilytica]